MNPFVPVAVFVATVATSTLAGYYLGKRGADAATNKAVFEANQANLKLNDEVVNGWARSVDYLRGRIRAGNAPRIPLPPPDPEGPAGGTNGGTPDPLPDAGELATCKAERTRLIEDCALTTIQLKKLQEWAK